MNAANRPKLSVSDCALEKAGHLDIEALYARASDARERAYAPYSGFRVGAAVLTRSGEVITAGNVENGSYGLTICAERAAVVRAIAEGHDDFDALAIAGDTDRAHTISPCGACLQVLAEFDPNEMLLVAYPDGDVLRVVCLRELLPVRFRLQAG
jgi:cytidine deaminase